MNPGSGGPGERGPVNDLYSDHIYGSCPVNGGPLPCQSGRGGGVPYPVGQVGARPGGCGPQPYSNSPLPYAVLPGAGAGYLASSYPNYAVYTGAGRGNSDTVRVYHYTTEAGAQGILRDGVIKASTSVLGDANGGRGVYFSTVDPHQTDTRILQDCWQNQIQQHPELPKRTQYALAFDVPRYMLSQPPNAPDRDVLMFQGDFHLGETTRPQLLRRF